MNEVVSISAQDQYSTLLSKVKAMEPYLLLLHQDYLLMTTYNIKFTYAVDFHEVWNYAEPLAKFIGGHQWDNPSLNQDEIFRRQIARAKLFYGLDGGSSCVLLPPYVDELKNKIKLLREKLLREGLPDINNDFRRQLENIAGNKIIRDAMSEFQKGKEVRFDDLDSFPLFLEDNVRKLLFYISGVAGQGLNIISDLLFGEDPKIKEAGSQWPELDSAIRKVTENKFSDWYGYFQRIRPSQESEASNFYDAKAIDLVLTINNRIVNNKKILILVSGAPTMKHVFRMQTDHLPPKYISTKANGISVLIPEFNDSVPLFRPIETYYYLTLFSADTSDGILKEIGAELDRINQVYLLGESIKKLQPSCDECKKNKRAKCVFSEGCYSLHIYEQLKNHQKHFDDYEEVLLAENRLSIIEPAWKRINAQRNEFETSFNKTTFALIEYLSQHRGNLDKRLHQREENLRELMDDQIRNALHAITNLALYQNEIGRGLANFTRVRYRINFKDKVIEALLNTVEDARDNSDTKLVAESIKKLIDYAYDEPDKSQKQLLWAVLLLCHRLPSRAVELAERTLDTMVLENAKEYHYVRVLARFVNTEYAKVVSECKVGIRNYVDDPRFYHLCGLAIGMLVLSGSNIPEPISWDIAINYEKDAYDLIEKNGVSDVNFRGAVVNNIAYFYCRRDEPEDLNKANDYIEILKSVFPSFSEKPEYINTLGWINKLSAFHEEDENNKKDYANKALIDFRQSLEIAQGLDIEPNEIDEYKKDLSDAEHELRDILKSHVK